MIAPQSLKDLESLCQKHNISTFEVYHQIRKFQKSKLETYTVAFKGQDVCNNLYESQKYLSLSSKLCLYRNYTIHFTIESPVYINFHGNWF